MKTLSIKQPWATLIAAGIKDIENRTWAPKYEGRILIHASSSKVPKNFDETRCIFEQYNNIYNEQLFGNLPKFEDMETSAIVGYATVRGSVQDSESIWAEPVEHQWIIEDAYLFDEPIKGVNGKLNLWDYPEIDENNLPNAHKLERKVPKIEGECLIIPIIDYEYEKSMESGMVQLSCTDEIMDLLLEAEPDADGNDVFKKITQVRLESPKETITLPVEELGYGTLFDNEDNTLKVINWNMEEMEYFNILIELGNLK